MTRVRAMRAAVAALAVTLAAVVSTAGASSPRKRPLDLFFHSPNGKIECQLSRHPPAHLFAYCVTFMPARHAILHKNGKTRVCRGLKCLSQGPEDAFALGYGHQARLGPFRCRSARSGMRCIVIRSGHGFKISRHRVRRF